MYTIPADKNARIPFAFKDKQGKDAKIDGAPLVTSSDETVARFSIDGGNIFVDTQGPGAATGTLSADADLGAGVTEVSRTFDVTITPLNADHAELGDAVLEDKPAA
jgi:hypothetical protein